LTELAAYDNCDLHTAMHLLFNLSPLIKLLAIFIFVIVLIRKRLSLGIALSAGSILLGLWFRLAPWQIGSSVIGSLTASRTLVLLLVVTLILILSHAMEKAGQMKRLLHSFWGISHNIRLNLTLFPAIIGLLPMPGGAIFSAPMVDEVSHQGNLDAEGKTLINYWFRHMWEFCWPLYPGVLLTCTLSGIDLGAFVLVQFPMTLVTAWVGYLMLLRSVPAHSQGAVSQSDRSIRQFLTELMPILLVVGGAVLFAVLIYLAGSVWPFLKTVKKEIPLIAALVIGICWVWRKNRMTLVDMQRICWNRSLLSMTLVIAGVMVFQGVLEDSRAVAEISESLTSTHVPIILVIVALPFLVGSITGITVAFVWATFPIIFSLLTNTDMADHLLAYTVLAFCSGYCGVLLSPLHVCLVLTCTYFKTDLASIYPKLALPCAAVAAAGFLSFLVNRFI
jgi:integral membrane protein (TIGR00529 family)